MSVSLLYVLFDFHTYFLFIWQLPGHTYGVETISMTSKSFFHNKNLVLYPPLHSVLTYLLGNMSSLVTLLMLVTVLVAQGK